ncbi:hypothetical protein [Palleronia caenipelagi]|uniref:SGNH/GDSL hydrolase family protein n=1 Tax=Palleronia caenipelagi TaxID=2489174 RepID=A0A547PQ28_9RHOB|nr:hypothetical protein [Palleronia caenipelagi]TRD16253.1 hypothetical protein FEV53_14480 [Palleronia caenipelagi]
MRPDKLETLDQLMSSDQAEEARAYFTRNYDMSWPSPFRCEITERVPPAPRSDSTVWQPEGATGLRGMLFRTVSAIDNSRRNRRFSEGPGHESGLPVITQGDSWFAFPIIEPVDVSESLGRLTPVYSLACPGDEMRDICRGEQLDELAWAVEETKARNVALSAGGNEMIGEEFPDILRPVDHAQSATDYLHLDRVNRKIAELIDGFERIIQHLVRIDPEIRVYAHSYDYPFPDVRQGRFMGRALDRAGIPPDRHRAVCSQIIDLLDNAMVTLTYRYPGTFSRVDFRGVSGARPDAWADEVHLTTATAALAARRLFDDIIRRNHGSHI